MDNTCLKQCVGALIGLVILLLAACTTTQKDGGPSFYVDESKIPDATPKTEPLSKYGNLSSYRVFGKNYYVMKSSKHYKARGIASWYGTKFQAQRTSSGEKYNMLGMTAAHKTLPLPTYVEVTNLANGKKVIVKVNDRGPFESNRLIDLSYVAAKKLGMLGHGTAYVDVKAIDPSAYNPVSYQTPVIAQNKALYPTKPAAVHLAKNPSISSRHPAQQTIKQPHGPAVYLQVGAFTNRAHAEKLKKRLVATIKSPVTITRLENDRILYRVQIGPMKDDLTARHLSKKLKSIGLMSKKSSRGHMEV